MISKFLSLVIVLIFASSLYGQEAFMNFKIDQKTGKAFVEISDLDKEFLMVTYLSQGLGSNDIGLDRGKIMNQRVVKFSKFGNKLLLIEPNYDYRAEATTNIAEKRAVREAFAKSVIYGFTVDSLLPSGNIRIDIAPMLTEDLADVAKALKDSKQGTYKVEKTRSVIDYNACLSFPLNIELESIITLVGEAQGSYVKSVTPTPEIVTVGQHVCFAQLPDEGYKKRAFHPYSGYFTREYFDYAAPINEPIDKRLIYRHRLEKRVKGDAPSEAVEPIIYYVDNGCPEPIKSALIEGASWWNQAFQAAGFINAFQVKELPQGAHPLDLRYNVIQWVHRSTRGWSYGATVSDPRTGEIIKGHVSLGSLRVRQDFMIAQGILSPYGDNDNGDSKLLELSLARLRQLSAHEVGHTIGLAHNFAASVNNRASVMDYPHPYITSAAGVADIKDSYTVGIGEWDKRAIIYGYKEIYKNEADTLKAIINQTQSLGLLYKSDADARPDNSASTEGHLWDNGKDAIVELDRIMKLRKEAIDKFGKATIKSGTPYSELEKVLVPLYFMHRYQAEAVSKYIGGQNYTYGVKGDKLPIGSKEVTMIEQKKALDMLLSAIDDKNLSLPTSVTELLYPPAMGFGRTNESMVNKTKYTFDEVSAKESAVGHVIDLLLQPARLNRVAQQQMGIDAYLNALKSNFVKGGARPATNASAIGLVLLMEKLITMRSDASLVAPVRIAINSLLKAQSLSVAPAEMAYISQMIKQAFEHPELATKAVPSQIPPGSPIGCTDLHDH